jgi:hypothetical protein
LNPHLSGDAARETPGVLLIDEVDMHLHPQWQQVVVGLLREAFPSLQMLLTTHTSAAPVNCLVTNALYSHTGRQVLIPAGARILGETKPVQTFGETRLAVSFHRLLMPDGRTSGSISSWDSIRSVTPAFATRSTSTTSPRLERPQPSA